MKPFKVNLNNDSAMASKTYDYIILGAGCAGLSLLMRMMEEPFFSEKKILVIDREKKNVNDRTWCFWEKENGLFESIVQHQWQTVNFYSDDYSGQLALEPYRYKMIRGIDFYEFILKKATSFSNIEFHYAEVLSVNSNIENAIVELENDSITATYIFNSIQFEKDKKAPTKNLYQLLQHFKGNTIKTEKPCFNPSIATLMDFRVSQQYGTAFFYLMPLTTTTALVEYTLFTEALLPANAYETALKEYIHQFLGIEKYEVLHEEFGIIPMTNQRFPLQQNRVVNMGVAGGQVKGSSGYAFQFIQKRTAAIVEGLIKGKMSFDSVSFQQKKGNLYDAVLLNVLHHHKMQGHQIFAAIFSKNKTESVLRFLDNESNLIEDLQIMNSVPTSIFLPAAMQELIH
jgi:lycopene beta-cyclase